MARALAVVMAVAAAVEVVDRDELRARLLEMAADDRTAADSAAEGFALERWGMIPPGTDYEALLVDLLTDQIAGYYDPDTKTLTISRSAGDDPAWAEMVLAHELDHGLQDQAFDLRRFADLPSSEGDAAAARHALVEGDGIALMIEVMVGRRRAKIDWSSPEIAIAIEQAMATPGAGNDGIDRAPLAIREAMLFPYRAGFGFVAALRRRQPWSAVDAAFARPPKSTEQILHPERYFADDPPVPVEARAPAALPGYAIAHATVCAASCLPRRRAHARMDRRENTRTRAGDADLGPSLVRRRPYCEPTLVPSRRPPALDHPAWDSISLVTQPALLRARWRDRAGTVDSRIA